MNINHTHFLQEEYILVEQKKSVGFGWVWFFIFTSQSYKERRNGVRAFLLSSVAFLNYSDFPLEPAA